MKNILINEYTNSFSNNEDIRGTNLKHLHIYLLKNHKIVPIFLYSS